MNINTVVAFILNNLFLVVAGGLVAVYLAYRMWQKVEATMAQTRSWGDLVFWAVKMIVIVGVLFKVGGWIYGTVNQAVVAAVNSPSVQTSGAALVQLGAAADQLVGWDGSSSVGGSGLVQSASMDIGGAVSLLEPVIAASAPVEVESAPASVEVLPSAPLQTVSNVQTVAPAPIQSVGSYIVKRGDSLAGIAKAFYGDSNKWVTICNANSGVLGGNCNSIRSGMHLSIPAAGSVSVAPLVATDSGPIAWGGDLVRPAPTYGPAPKAAVEPAYDLSAKNFWSQFKTADK